MPLSPIYKTCDSPEQLAELFDRLWPIFRSITGPGVRQTHDILGEYLPLKRWEIPSGKKIFDWVVPDEWVYNEAYVVGPNEQRVIDVHENNLHLLGYSTPFRGHMSRADLDEHLYSLTDQPSAIPYLTSYYKARWGFCLSHKQRLALPAGDYEVIVDTELKPGGLSLAEAVLPGESDREILFSTYTCHPSLANNELSGPLVVAALYARLASLPKRKFTYRFAFLSETIGCLAYLDKYGPHFLDKLHAGYVVKCAGDKGDFTYKLSRKANTPADRAMKLALRDLHLIDTAKIIPFDPSDGSDERQYCSPGFDLPVGSLMRTMYGEYPEYHTSLDNRSLISFDAMSETVDVYFAACQILEKNGCFENTVKFGEPCLGKRGLYPSIGGHQSVENETAALLWLLNESDGSSDLMTIAEKSGHSVSELSKQAGRCLPKGLLRHIS